MADVSVGQIVFSKAGRDKGNYFIVIDYKAPYVFLCDGKLRRLENPKKKKDKHIQTTNFIDTELKVVLENQHRVNNADIRKTLSHFFEEIEPKS